VPESPRTRRRYRCRSDRPLDHVVVEGDPNGFVRGHAGVDVRVVIGGHQRNRRRSCRDVEDGAERTEAAWFELSGPMLKIHASPGFSVPVIDRFDRLAGCDAGRGDRAVKQKAHRRESRTSRYPGCRKCRRPGAAAATRGVVRRDRQIVTSGPRNCPKRATVAARATRFFNMLIFLPLRPIQEGSIHCNGLFVRDVGA